MRAAIASLLLTALLCLPVSAQDSGSPAVPPPAPPGSAGGAAPGSPAPSRSAPPTSAGLVSSTLAGDIQTASYYELVAWCRQLGLDESGSRKDLQARLAEHFHVTLEEPKPAAGRRIMVRSAKDSEYFTITEVNEKYVVLRGDVVVEIADAQSDAVQQIRTQELTYNQSRGSVTATGGVVYTITQGGKTETFQGASLSFDVDSGEGAFYDGRTSKPQKRGTQDFTFFFQGDTISRLENDSAIMDNGGITSCDDPDPHYQVRASRVWILAPGEWAAQNAVLYLGRVPILYLPVFFFPGDQILFNPAFGYDVREGAYIQTTTYLIGKKKPQQGGLSFLQLGQEDESAYDQELRGIFLRKIPAKKDAKPDSGASLKLFADAYSRLGLYTALVGDFPTAVTFRVGAAVSRTIFGDAFSGYTPFLIQNDGTDASYWNGSSVFGLTLPFRFEMSGTLKGNADFGSLSAAFEYYSDPFFTADFYNRSEGLQLTTDLNALLSQTQTVPLKSNLSWDFTSRADFSRVLNVPLVQSLTIPNLNMKFSWQSKTATPSPTVPAAAAAADPGRVFYYPSSLAAPTVSASLSGELLHLGGSPASAGSQGQPAAAPPQPAAAGPPAGAAPPVAGAASATDPTRLMHPPRLGEVVEGGEPPKPPQAGQPGGQSAPRFSFRAPQRGQDAGGAPQPQETTASVTYQVQPRATLEQTFDPTNWYTPKDVDFRLLYGTLETGGSSKLTGTFTLPDRVFDSSVALTGDGNYRLRYSPNPGSVYQSLLASDLQQDQFMLRTILQASVKPFVSVPILSGSSVSYRLNERLFQVRLVGDPSSPLGTTLGPAWDTDSVLEHSLQGSLALLALGQTDTVSVTAQLPPLIPTVTGRLDLAVWQARASLQGGAVLTAGAWTPQPLTASASVAPLTDVTFSQDAQFDLTAATPDKTLTRATSQLKLWGFSSTFTAQTMLPVDGLGRPTGSPAAFLPSTFRIGYDYSGGPFWFWRNRIKLQGSVKSGWSMNLQKYTDNTLDFALTLTLSIYQFLDLSFSSVSNNTGMYRYFPSLVGNGAINPVVDLLRSFNFFNDNDRRASLFKIRSLSIKVVHHLHDWDLNFEYQGSPQLRVTGGRQQYEWNQVFAIRVQWNAIPEVQSTMSADSTGLNLRGATASTQPTQL